MAASLYNLRTWRRATRKLSVTPCSLRLLVQVLRRQAAQSLENKACCAEVVAQQQTFRERGQQGKGRRIFLKPPDGGTKNRPTEPRNV